MRGVGPGTVLGGRYTVHKRLEQLRDTERWTADDGTLGRSVALLTVAMGDPRTPALLDAARRAASVTQSTFVRILDVGTDGDVAFVVEEDLRDARTLGALVDEGGLPADEVRRITGEVAAALESARARGMHHLDLTPDDVLRTPEGDIRLRGLEVAAARAGDEAADPEDAARRDAVGVVALAYAGLTGLWPLGAGGSGLGPAPRVPGGVAAPSEIAAGVPRDLDALCRLTLNDDQGPLSPGDYARQVAPWSSRQVVGRPVTPMAPVLPDEPAGPPGGPAAMPDDAAVPPSPGRPVAGEETTPRPPTAATPEANGAVPTPGVGEPASAPSDATTTALPAESSSTASMGAAATPDADDDTGSSDAGPPPGRRRRGLAGLAGLVGAGAAAVRARAGSITDRGADEPPPTAPEDREPPPAPERPSPAAGGPGRDDLPWLSPRPDRPGPLDSPASGDNGSAPAGRPAEPAEPAEPDDPQRSADLVPAGERHPVPVSARDNGQSAGRSAGPATGHAVVGVLGTVGGRVTQYARRAVDKVSELSPDTQRVTPDAAGDAESMPVMIPADPLTRDESKLALAIVAAFVILALVVGLYGVSRIGKGSSDIFGPAAAPVTRTTTITPSASGSGSASASGASEQGSAPLQPVAIQGVQAYDPEGDGYEHDELVGTVFDGDPNSGWYTESYSSGEFGGIKKGVGLIVDLGATTSPREIQLQLPNKGGLEVWVNSSPSLDGATKIGDKDPAEGEVDFTVPDDVEGQYVILWYTKVYPDSQGGIRGFLNEVTVLG